jgi:TrmH family RNA methyltransferase
VTPGPVGLELIQSLRTRRARDQTGTFFAEGVRFLVAAVDARADIVSLVVAPKLLKSGIGPMLVRRLRQKGVPELRVSPEEFAAVSASREPQGVARATCACASRWSAAPTRSTWRWPRA